MLESTFPDSNLFKEENEVYLRFKEIDFESRQAKENHLTDIFLKNAITHDELRTGMGYEPFNGQGWPTSTNKKQMFTKGDGDWANTNYGLVERDKVLIQAVDEPASETAQAESRSRTSQNKAKASSGGQSVSNKNTPSNQYGTRPSAKVNKDSLSENIISSLNVIYMQKSPLENMYDTLTSDIDMHIRRKGAKISELKFLINSGFGQAKNKLISLSQKAYRIGLQDVGVQAWEVRSHAADNKINDHIEFYTNKLREDIIKQLDKYIIKSVNSKTENAILAGLVMRSLKHRSVMIDKSEIMRSYNYGKASGYRIKGFETIKSVRNGSTVCNVCDKQPLIYNNTDDIIFEELPPLHPECTCTMDKKA